MLNKNVVFIPMRSGSKGIKNKNIKLFCGQPLFYWGIHAALRSKCFDEIIISTDAVEYEKMVSDYFPCNEIKIDLRPDYLAADEVSTEDVLLEFFGRTKEYDESLCVLHQVTSPFVEADNFKEIVHQYLDGSYDSLLSVVLFKRFIWDQSNKPLNYNPAKRPRRQDMDNYYCENGALYAFGVKSFVEQGSRLFGEIGAIEMPEDTLVEIDEPRDWIIAEKLFKDKKNA